MYGLVDYANGNWLVQDLKPHASIRFKDVFKGIESGMRPPFILKDRPTFVRDLEWFMQRYPLALTGRAQIRKAEQLASWGEIQARLEALQAVNYVPPLLGGFRAPLAPQPHQVRAAELFRAQGSLLVLDDVGLGKTVTALAAVADGFGLPAAVVVEANLSAQWVKEYINRFTHLKAIKVKDRNARALPAADVYVFRYSNVAAWVDVVPILGIQTVIFDEVQNLRHGRSTDKGRAAAAIRAEVPYAMGLSATPIYNYGSEIWHVVEAVRPGALGGWGEFSTNWCRFDGKHYIVTDPQALGAFLLDEGIAVRRTNTDAEVANVLPGLSKTVFEVDWNEGDAESDRELQRRLAQRVLTGSFTERGMAARELDLLLRQETGIAKARSVAAYVRTLVEGGESVLLGGWHREVYRIWQESLADLKPLMFTGSETQAQKQRAKVAMMNGDSKVMMMSLRSGAGLDGLQQAVSHVVFGELDWSPQVHTQFVGRVHRYGQTRPVTVHYLVTDNGSDPVIMDTLGLKASQSHGILNPWASFEAATPTDDSRMRTLARSVLGLGGNDG